jgi:hypothetical protein
MTPQEFKAWFDGFTEALSGVPTKAQWARIKERVGEIDGKPVTERVFIDRYYPQYMPYYRSYGLYGTGACNTMSTLNAVGQNLSAASNNMNVLTAGSFSSANAMADLGRADAKALAA